MEEIERLISACHSEIEWELWGTVSLAPAGGAGGVAAGCTQCVWVPALFGVAIGIVARLWRGWESPRWRLGLLCASETVDAVVCLGAETSRGGA